MGLSAERVGDTKCTYRNKASTCRAHMSQDVYRGLASALASSWGTNVSVERVDASNIRQAKGSRVMFRMCIVYRDPHTKHILALTRFLIRGPCSFDSTEMLEVPHVSCVC